MHSRFLVEYMRTGTITPPVVVLLIALAAFLIGCTRGVVGGNPTLATSGTSGTSRVLDGTEAEVRIAISNAFETLGYHDMLLVPVDPDVGATLARGWMVTNGFQLLHGL